MDYFTAVDDLQPSDTSGSSHIGMTAFNSACFYRYARIDWQQLCTNLSGDIALTNRTVAAFLQTALLAIPSGKQNTFANQNPPSLALAVVRKDGLSWALTNAFEKPITTNGRNPVGWIGESISALETYYQHLVKTFGSLANISACTALVLTPTVNLSSLAAFPTNPPSPQPTNPTPPTQT